MCHGPSRLNVRAQVQVYLDADPSDARRGSFDKGGAGAASV